ncbi:MAG: single-stranded DNA-binding protein [Candidatus Acidiferrales bacterium]
MSVNKVILIGNVGKDPEVKTTQTGSTFCLFSVATNETFKSRGGEAQKRTEWHSVIARGKIADICSEYVAAGKPVYIEGSIRTRKWTDREGAERTDASASLSIEDIKVPDAVQRLFDVAMELNTPFGWKLHTTAAPPTEGAGTAPIRTTLT